MLRSFALPVRAMLPTDSGARAHLRAYLRATLLSDHAHPPSYPVRVSVQDCNGYWQETVFTRQELLQEMASVVPMPSTVPDLTGLQRIHRKLLEKAGPIPTTAKKLVQLAGYELNSYSRAAVTELVRRGLLVRTADGLRTSQ